MLPLRFQLLSSSSRGCNSDAVLEIHSLLSIHPSIHPSIQELQFWGLAQHCPKTIQEGKHPSYIYLPYNIWKVYGSLYPPPVHAHITYKVGLLLKQHIGKHIWNHRLSWNYHALEHTFEQATHSFWHVGSWHYGRNNHSTINIGILGFASQIK